MKYLDLPPIWLLGALILTRISPWGLPWGAAFWPGVILLSLAAGLVAAALWEFARARTTPIPHQHPSALIDSGIFRWTRNPIYLADILILAGFTLVWAKMLGLVLLPILVALLDRRFIRTEEARLTAAFGDAFEAYAARTRRWL
ncbi:MAG: isoprenylcysteine carboxylmethyltransferase family protein [Pseudomonadota bacterium]